MRRCLLLALIGRVLERKEDHAPDVTAQFELLKPV